jgi:hypothetical protein
MDRTDPDFSTSTFIAALCLDAKGDMQLAGGSNVFELRFADDESPEALRQVRIEQADETPEFGPWYSAARPDQG